MTKEQIPNPCGRDCKDCSPTCHAKCPRYAEYAQWREKMRAEKEKENTIVEAIVDAHRYIMKKTRYYQHLKKR